MDPDEPLHNRVTYIAQSVTCLATEACLTADPGVMSSILVQSHTFMKIGHEIISVVILLPFAESFKMGCCYKRFFLYVHEVLVNRFIKFTQEKVLLDELTIP